MLKLICDLSKLIHRYNLNHAVYLSGICFTEKNLTAVREDIVTIKPVSTQKTEKEFVK